jgi:hypothetical protein
MVFTFSTKITNPDDSSVQCSNCAKQKKAGVLSRAQLHLTTPLLKHAQDAERPHIHDIRREQVATYLKDMLHWNVGLFFLFYLLLVSSPSTINVGVWSSPRYCGSAPSNFRNGWDWQA